MSETPADPARLVVLLSGRGSNFQAIERAVSTGRLPARIPAVISDRADAAGLSLARTAGIDTVALERRSFPDRARFENHLRIAIDGFAPRFVVLAGFMRVLGQGLVNHYRGRLINIHPSLLPKHRGLHTHQRVLDAGETEHGASVHFVTPALDAGPVVSQVRMPVRPGDTPDTLAERLLPLEHRLYVATLALLLQHRVEIDHDRIAIDDKTLDKPLVLGHDLHDPGRHDSKRDGD